MPHIPMIGGGNLPLVGMTGFEPATSWSQTRRATNCATSRESTEDPVYPVIIANEVFVVKYYRKVYRKKI